MKVTEFNFGVVKYFITECPNINQLEEFKNIIIKNKVPFLLNKLLP